MNTKKRAAVERAVLDAYKQQCPKWTGVHVESVIENRVLDTIVAVKADGFADSEICVYRKGEVTIFSNTPELMRYVDGRASQVVTYKDILVGIIVVSMLAIFAGIVFLYQDQNAIAMVTTAVAGILGTFVGVKIKDNTGDA